TPADLPSDVHVTFAKENPVVVRCQQGTVHLTLAIAELSQGTRQWRDFEINAQYEPQIEDLHVRLVRKGPIELGGDSYKGQSALVLRGVFAKLLPRERSVELVPKIIADNRNFYDLVVTQAVIEDGWLAIAIGPDHSAGTPREAAREG